MLRTQKYAHLTYYCSSCRKNYKGLNVMRHALAHLKSGKLKCILCGKCFKQLNLAKKHIRDHVEEIHKQKPHDKESGTEDIPATNGLDGAMGNPAQPKPGLQISVSNEETHEPRRGGKIKVSSLRREDRIIRNIRTLIKKTSVLQRNSKNAKASILKQADFKDEQVVIEDGLVIVKETREMKVEIEGEGNDQDKPAAENGYGADITYHLCPSLSCDRVFLKIGTTLTRHAVRCHINEDEVLEKTYVWSKHKCTLCLR